MLVQVGLFGLENRNAGLSLLVFGLLRGVVALHLLFGVQHVLGERGSDVSRFASQILLQLLFLLAQGLNLIMVEVQLLSEGLARLLKAVDFALESRVERVRLRLTHI